MRRLGMLLLLVAAACGGGDERPAAPTSPAKTGSPSAVAAAAGCAGPTTWPDEGATHVSPPERVRYRTDPPTSGSHYGTPAETGIHSAAAQDEAMVHNMEHGHVIIHYLPGKVGASIVSALEEVARSAPSAVLLTPRSGDHPYAVAFAAWRVSQLCAEPTERIKDLGLEFVARNVGHGPEGLLPGRPTAETGS